MNGDRGLETCHLNRQSSPTTPRRRGRYIARVLRLSGPPHVFDERSGMRCQAYLRLTDTTAFRTAVTDAELAGFDLPAEMFSAETVLAEQ